MAGVKFDDAAVRRLFEGPDGVVAKGLAKKAVQVERTAKRLCPVDTGRLRSSITWSLEQDGRGLYALVGTNVVYAAYVEFGTRFMAAQPFLRPALRERF